MNRSQFDLAMGLDLSGGNIGPPLITGNNSTFSGAGDWASAVLTWDVNSTVAGKLYMLGDGGGDFVFLAASALTLIVGARYKCTLKARLNAGASTTIRVGVSISIAGKYFEITPTGTEQTFSGYFTASATTLTIGLGAAAGGFNGIAFEIDDVDLRRVY